MLHLKLLALRCWHLSLRLILDPDWGTDLLARAVASASKSKLQTRSYTYKDRTHHVELRNDELELSYSSNEDRNTIELLLFFHGDGNYLKIVTRGEQVVKWEYNDACHSEHGVRAREVLNIHELIRLARRSYRKEMANPT